MPNQGRKSKTPESVGGEKINKSIDQKGSTAERTITKRSLLIKSSSSGYESNDKQEIISSSRKESQSHPEVNYLTINRKEEKDELAHLNDRFTTYIDYVKNLETDKEKLKKKINSFSKIKFSELGKFNKDCEHEINSLRDLVNDLAKRQTNLKINLKNSQDKERKIRIEFDNRDYNLTNLQRKFNGLEKELSQQRDSNKKYCSQLTQQNILEKSFAKLNKDLDGEILKRKDIESQNALLKDQIEFNNKVHQETCAKFLQSQILLEEDIETRKRIDYESRLAEELRNIRYETVKDFENYKVEFEQSFMLRLTDLMKNNQEINDNNKKSKNDIFVWRTKAENLDQELSNKVKEIELLKKQVKDIEKLLQDENNEFKENIDKYRNDLNLLKSDLQKCLDDFSSLLNTKIKLDQEILEYRNLLESGGVRFHRTVVRKGETNLSLLNSKLKRRRVGDMGEFVESEIHRGSYNVTFGRESFKVDLVSLGTVEFSHSPDCTGRCVKLVNRTDKDIFIGDWILKYTADNQEMTYQFNQNFNIKAKSDCTIWSCDSNQIHNPPSDLVMKGQRFFSGSNIRISLYNTENKEEASCYINKENLISPLYHYYHKIPSSRYSNEKICTMM